MLALAHARIAAYPDKYQSHIYGENEAGGTSVLFLSSVAPEQLGFNIDVEDDFYPELTGEFLERIPLEMAAVAALMGAALLFRRKRLS
jgi:formate dehydrogenase iron-sulfur subunit